MFAYVGGLGGFAGLLLASHNGVRLLLGVALCVIAYDVFGFFVGSQFGHTAGRAADLAEQDRRGHRRRA